MAGRNPPGARLSPGSVPSAIRPLSQLASTAVALPALAQPPGYERPLSGTGSRSLTESVMVVAGIDNLMSAVMRILIDMPDELQIVSFPTVQHLWSWLERHHDAHPGVWVELQKAGSPEASIGFHDLLEAGIAYGWSESTRRGHTPTSFLQKFTPRRTRGTTSERNSRIADRLESEGRITPAGRRALGR